MNERELRSSRDIELRADGDAGEFSGYITKWGTVDSYNSTFIEGAFKKTIKERGHRIKVLYDHGEKTGNSRLIGKLIEIREDSIGVFVRGKLTMDVEEARDAFAHMKAEVLDTLSFGFKTIRDRWVDGVRQILEVKLFEVSPVTFEANEAAMITDVRKDGENTTEERATNYDETAKHQELMRGGWTLTDALSTTLMDIWWDTDTTAENITGLLDDALTSFHAAYLAWAQEFVETFWTDNEQRSKPNTNELRAAFSAYVDGRSLESIAAESEFTVDELRALESGQLLAPGSRHKLAALSDEVRSAHQSVRRTLVESLCTELRQAGISHAEQTRFSALLNAATSNNESNEERGEAFDLSPILDAVSGLSWNT